VRRKPPEAGKWDIEYKSETLAAERGFDANSLEHRPTQQFAEDMGTGADFGGFSFALPEVLPAKSGPDTFCAGMSENLFHVTHGCATYLTRLR
jgi:hypothetical protein